MVVFLSIEVGDVGGRSPREFGQRVEALLVFAVEIRQPPTYVQRRHFWLSRRRRGRRRRRHRRGRLRFAFVFAAFGSDDIPPIACHQLAMPTQIRTAMFPVGTTSGGMVGEGFGLGWVRVEGWGDGENGCRAESQS